MNCQVERKQAAVWRARPQGRRKWRKPALRSLRGVISVSTTLPSLLLRLPDKTSRPGQSKTQALANLVSGERSLKSPPVRTLILLDQGPTHVTSINLNRGKTSHRGMSREGRSRKVGICHVGGETT